MSKVPSFEKDPAGEPWRPTRCRLPPAPAPDATATSSATPTASSTATAHGDGFLLLGLGFRRVVDEQGFQGQAVRQEVVPDVVASDAQAVKLHGLTVLHRHLDGFQVGVHGNVDASYRAVDLGAILELYCHCFVTQFHQKSD